MNLEWTGQNMTLARARCCGRSWFRCLKQESDISLYRPQRPLLLSVPEAVLFQEIWGFLAILALLVLPLCHTHGYGASRQLTRLNGWRYSKYDCK